MDKILEPILSPLRPHLQPLTRNLPEPLNQASISLLGQKCHATLIRNLDPDPACLSLALSKGLGVGIIGASSVVKIPQLLKLLSSRSAAGISFAAYLMELASQAVGLAYNARSGFPFSTYGEQALIAAQNLAIAAAVLHFSGRSSGAAIFVAAAAAAGAALSNDAVVPMQALRSLAAGAGALGVASKVPQIVAIWSEGGTGQLSAFAVFNYLFGSLSRIFTTLQEVDDPVILYGFVAGFALNAVIAAQMIYYWNSSSTSSTSGSSSRNSGKSKGGKSKAPAVPSKSAKRSTGKKAGGSGDDPSYADVAAATPAKGAPVVAAGGKTKSPSTRRRG